MRKGIFVAFGLLVLALPASAQMAEPQALTIEAENLSAQSAERADQNSGVTIPGDLIEYRLTFTNHQDSPVSQVVLNDPIPAGLVFVPGSVTGSRDDLQIEYSVDDGSTWSPDPRIEVDVDGQTVLRPAPAEAFTHVRWTVTGAVNPGAQVTARFRARVAADTNPDGES